MRALSILRHWLLSSLAFSVGKWLGTAVVGRARRGRSMLHRHKHDNREASSLAAPGRAFAVVTTAALPWRTGEAGDTPHDSVEGLRRRRRRCCRRVLPQAPPACMQRGLPPAHTCTRQLLHSLLDLHAGTSINPMLRVAHLAADPQRRVALVVPWVVPEQQPLIYPAGVTFTCKEEQAEFILQGKNGQWRRARVAVYGLLWCCNLRVYMSRGVWL